MKDRNVPLRGDTLALLKSLIPIIMGELNLTTLTFKDALHYILEDFRKSRQCGVSENSEGLGDK